MADQAETPLLRLAHLSDLHFSKFTWNPSQFFSKRWLGNLNLLLKRKHTFATDHLTTLFPLLQKRKVDILLITGDLTSTSHAAEFLLAKQFISTLEEKNFKVFLIPGNHDHYTKNAYKQKRFYQFFNASYSSSTDPIFSLNLKEDGLAVAYLGSKWWLIGIDTTIATALIFSKGYFSFKLEQALESALREIPIDHKVILMNHFPLFANESERKSLMRREALKTLIERFPKIKLFLHGHTHRHTIADLRSSRLPIILDSGATAQKKEGTWHLIDISTCGCEIEVFKSHHKEWKTTHKLEFKW